MCHCFDLLVVIDCFNFYPEMHEHIQKLFLASFYAIRKNVSLSLQSASKFSVFWQLS